MNVAAAACRLAAHRARTAASRAGTGASRPSPEKSSCWLSASASPVDGAGPLPSANPRRDSGSVGLRDPGRSKSDQQPAGRGAPPPSR
jgi:hypothetical protein